MARTGSILAGLGVAALGLACAPDVSPLFTPREIPEDQAAFNRGNLGLITATLEKSEELIAFRLLSGLPVDAPARVATKRADPVDSPEEVWRKARSSVLPPPQSASQFGYYGSFGIWRMSHASKNVYYPNCLDDAFLTATHTLTDRRQQYRDDASLQAWAQAQDLVFANCSGVPLGSQPSYPAEPGPGLSALARADREYQIAASHFYAEEFDGAEKLFRAISTDQSSAWRETAAYMVGRTLLREFSLAKKTSAAEAARAVFQQIASDPSAGTLRDSARGLVEHLDAIAHSAETMQSLADQLLAPRAGPAFADTIEQSRYILVADSFHEMISKPDTPEPFDWVNTLESKNEAHALARWRATNRLPWLTVAMIYASGKDDSAADLIAAAGRVPTDSPASVTTTYHALRLRIERSEKDEPRAQLDRLLATEQSQPASTRNAWRGLRMGLATSFDDFLRWAPRTPTNARDFSTDPHQTSPVLADDSVEVLNYATPLAKIARAAGSPRLPAWSTSQLALAGWTRAFMLDNATVMNALAPRVAADHPKWGEDLTAQSGANKDAWRFRASLMIARDAQFTPMVYVDFRKPLDPNDGWWCAVGQKPAWQLAIPPKATPIFPDAVFSPAEQAEAKRQVERLGPLGSAQSILGPVILAWAKTHPDDSLVPEALYRLVRITRYGCREEKNNGTVSKAAFDMLHKRYPGNLWTAKTPYWFN